MNERESPGLTAEEAGAQAIELLGNALAEAITELKDTAVALREAEWIINGTVPHLYMGECPDDVEGPERRDPDCPACQWLAAREAKR